MPRFKDVSFYNCSILEYCFTAIAGEIDCQDSKNACCRSNQARRQLNWNGGGHG